MDIAQHRSQSANALEDLLLCDMDKLFFDCEEFIINVLIKPEVNWSFWVAT